MIGLTLRVTGDKQILSTLNGIVQRAQPPGRGRMLAGIGQRVALRHMPATIRENRLGWPRPSSHFRAWRQGGQPIVDTGRLVNSWAWRATQSNVWIWTAVRYARQLDRGGVIRPRGKFLLIPLSPPLKMTEARGWPRGKSAIQARYPGSFFLLRGPEGTGIYRKGRTKLFMGLGAKKARYGIERIAAARRQINQRGYHFGHWRQEWMPDLIDVSTQILIHGRGPNAPATGGKADRGPRGGQTE